MVYRPPFRITPAVLAAHGDILRLLGRFEGRRGPSPAPQLRRSSRVRTVQASLAIEGIEVAEEQVTAILQGKRVVGPVEDVRAVRNAIAAYERAPSLRPEREADLLTAHALLMKGLLHDAGKYRRRAVGVLQGDRVAHLAPPAKRVPELMSNLLSFVGRDRETHPLVKSAAVHYEIEFIHPFMDGNGRLGRLWQHVVLVRFAPAFAHVPVESVIRARQGEYYRALGESDKSGEATPFIEFSLRAVHEALESFLTELAPGRMLVDERLQRALEHFEARTFSRREYIALLQPISPATASRDLATAVRSGLLKRTGDKATARYRFVRARRVR